MSSFEVDEQTEFVALSSLGDTSGSVPVKVRICRMWESRNMNDDTLLTLDMILADDQGTPMWAQIKRTMVDRFRPQLAVGHVYAIKNFRIITVGGRYRPVDTKLRLLFSIITRVKQIEIPTPSIPVHVFQFVPHATVIGRAGNPAFLTDLVGSLVSVGEVEFVPGGKRKRDLEVLTKSSGRVRVTLWSRGADTFVMDHNIRTTPPPILIVFTSMTVRQYVDALCFSSTGCTQIYVGLDHPEVTSLHSTFAASAQQVLYLGRSPGTNGTAEEAMTENRMPLSDILNVVWADEKPGYRITFPGTISKISTKYGWYYLGCPHCKSKATLTNEKYTCKGCKKPFPSPSILFKLNFTVVDCGQVLYCTAMNNVSERMVDSSAMKLFNRAAVGNSAFPREVLDLCGREYIFKIQLSDYNLHTGDDVFTVIDVFTKDPEVQASAVETPSDGSPSPLRSRRRLQKGKDIANTARSEVDVTPSKKPRIDLGDSEDDDVA